MQNKFIKKTILTLAFALVQILTFAQAPPFNGKKALIGRITSIQTTPESGYIMAGRTFWDAWVVKLDAIGTNKPQKKDHFLS